MANTLKMAEVYAIHALLERGWSRRRIAQVLGIDRETVSRYARLAAAASGGAPSGAPLGCGPPKPATAPPGSEPDGRGVYERELGSNPASAAPPGSAASGAAAADSPGPAPGSQSRCVPFHAVILAKLDQGLSAQRIHQDLVAEHGFSGKYHSVRRFVRRLGQATPLPFRRMECAPGEEAQIDFGRGAPLVGPAGKRRVPHGLRVILSHSRKGYRAAVARQSTEDFIRALENAFHHFGGVPRTLVPDNWKAAVLQADGFDPELNPKIQAFCQHYGTTLLPTRPRRPRPKGQCEAGVKFVQNNGLKGRQFASLADENRHLAHWEATVADTRIHGTTRQQVGKVFAEVERPALLPLPAARFPFFQEVDRKVHRDGQVEVAKAYYSAPPEYVGQRVWVRWDGHVVRIFNRQWQPIALPAQREPGRFAGLAAALDVRLQEASGQPLNHVAFLELLLQDERAVRNERRMGRRVKAAGFREQKTLEDFDWQFNPSIQKKVIYDLATGRFIREARPLLFLGPPGTGKSHLVQARGYQAIKSGFPVLYRSIFDLLRDFLHDEALGGQERILARYLKPDLAISDDFGMRQLPKRSGEYRFEILLRRYEVRSTSLTSNRPLEDWGKRLGDVPMATAILDRFLHHADVISITGRSYRLRQKAGRADLPQSHDPKQANEAACSETAK